MSATWSMLCDGPELAIDAAAHAERTDLHLQYQVDDDLPKRAFSLLEQGNPVAIAWGEATPTPETLLQLADAAVASSCRVPIALLAADAGRRGLARDLGLPAVADIGPLITACKILDLPAERPWFASTHPLTPADRARMGQTLGRKSSGVWMRVDGGLLGHAQHDDQAIPIGTPHDTALACAALRYSEATTRARVLKVSDVDPEAIREVILGPPRALSDPASKAALRPYDVPLPLEEFCVTPSRAASEASRIGFPVRIALASPDLRVWDHPELVVHNIENAAGSREAFRQILALAASQSENARLLGVTVSAQNVATALLNVRMTPCGHGVHTTIAFADSHGRAADDRTETILPTTVQGLENAVNRLTGASLLLNGNAKERRRALSQLGDVLLRLAAFVHEWRHEITSVEVNPLARLVDGEFEIREACVVVGDAFSKSLQASG